MNLSVVGDNLTAIVTSCCLAELGNQVTLFSEQRDPSKSNLIEEEPLLKNLFNRVVEKQFLQFQNSFQPLIKHSHIIFIALEDEHEIALIISSIIKNNQSKDQLTIILQCTHSVGFANKLQHQLIEQSTSKVVLINFPSFIKEGSALNDFRRPDRIIIGYSPDLNGEFKQSVKPIVELLEPFSLRENLFVFMSQTEAEYTRLAVNALLASRLSLMNEMANAAENLGVDITAVRKGIGTDQRIGPHYLYPGCGYGGEFIDKHIEEFCHLLNQVGADASLLDAAIESNKTQKEVLFRKLWKIFRADLKGKTFTIWGVSFKPGSRSVSNAPSIVMAKTILSQGANIQFYDPMANQSFEAYCHENFPEFKNNIIAYDRAMTATEKSDALIILTEWKEFFSPDFAQLKKNLSLPIILDGRNLYEPQKMKSLGFDYYGIGRGITIK